MSGLPNTRFLPATIGVLAILLGVKAVALTETALAGETGAGGQPSAAAPADKRSDTSLLPVIAPPAILEHVSPGRPEAAKEAPDPRLVDDLQTERAAIDRERSALDAREAASKAASDALERRMAALEALDRKLADTVTLHQAQDDNAWCGLVKVYEAMRPDDAATIFNGLEIHTLLQLLARMNERKAALVLGAMQPERARVATQMLAQQRLRDLVGPTPASSPG